MPRISKNQPVIVHRIVNNGTVFKSIEYNTFKEATQFTAMSLVDNGYANKKSAQEWQATIKDFGIYRYADMMFEFVPYATREDDSTLGYIFAQMEMTRRREAARAVQEMQQPGDIFDTFMNG